MFVSRLSVVYQGVVGFVYGGGMDYVYRVCLFFLLCSFLWIRVPYLYGVMGFGLYLVLVIFPMFVALFFGRLFDGGVYSFFSGFVPSGTPMWIAPFVCLAETLSYIVRPVVLMIRPFVNLTIGVFGGSALSVLGLKFGWGVFLSLFILFFYEVFVALVHWFIVCNILSFSEDH